MKGPSCRMCFRNVHGAKSNPGIIPLDHAIRKEKNMPDVIMSGNDCASPTKKPWRLIPIEDHIQAHLNTGSKRIRATNIHGNIYRVNVFTHIDGRNEITSHLLKVLETVEGYVISDASNGWTKNGRP